MAPCSDLPLIIGGQGPQQLGGRTHKTRGKGPKLVRGHSEGLSPGRGSDEAQTCIGWAGVVVEVC